MSDASDRAKNLMRRPANPLFLNTIVLGGSTEEKVTAAQAAGFDQIELWRQDVEAFPQGAVVLKTRLETLHLSLTDYQPLLDFDGAPPNRRDAKRQEAETMSTDTSWPSNRLPICLNASKRRKISRKRPDPQRIQERCPSISSRGVLNGLNHLGAGDWYESVACRCRPNMRGGPGS